MGITQPSRNARCPCGSGKRYKKCCLQKGESKNNSSSNDRETTASNPNLLYLISALLIAAILVVYWPVGTFDFVSLDDYAYVSENPRIQNGLTWQAVRWALSADLAYDSVHADFWIPITYLSHILTIEFFGLDSGAHHRVNLAFHILNSVLLLFVMRRLTGELWRSAFVAASFALHPLNVESVAWVTERKDVLSTLFWILTLWAYARYVERKGIARYLLLVFFFVSGLLSKPMLVTLPFVLLLLDYWPLKRLSIGNSKQVWPLISEKVPLFALAAAISVSTYLSLQRAGGITSLGEIPFGARLVNSLVSYASYIRKMAWPVDLAVFYPHPGSSLPLGQVVGAGLSLASIAVLVIWTSQRYRYLTVGWLWYLGTLVPVIGLLQAGGQAMADRYAYLPMIGLYIMVAWGIPELAANLKHRRTLLITTSGMLFSVLMTVSRLQAKHWQSSIALFEHALSVTGANNWLAHNNLGVALAEQGRLEEAAAHYLQALRGRHDYAEAHYNLGTALFELGKIEEALPHLEEALRIKPDYAEAHNQLGMVAHRQGKTTEAMGRYLNAARIKPEFAEAHNNMGVLLAEQGELEAAVVRYGEALHTKPNFAGAHINLGIALARQREHKRAADHFAEALRLKPDDAEAHFHMGNVFLRQENFEKAAAHYFAALRTKPDYPTARTNLGEALARQGKFDTAVDQHTEALRLQSGSARTHYRLGNALMQSGRFREARDHYSEAVRIKPDFEKAHHNLGVAYLKLGSKKDAARQFNRVLQINPSSLEARRILELIRESGP